MLTGWMIVILGLIYGVFVWYPDYIYKKHLAEGWIWPKGWDCPVGHRIKANSKSMIYHHLLDPYWTRTNAMNGKCFDTATNAELQGYRPIFNGN